MILQFYLYFSFIFKGNQSMLQPSYHVPQICTDDPSGAQLVYLECFMARATKHIQDFTDFNRQRIFGFYIVQAQQLGSIKPKRITRSKTLFHKSLFYSGDCFLHPKNTYIHAHLKNKAKITIHKLNMHCYCVFTYLYHKTYIVCWNSIWNKHF